MTLYKRWYRIIVIIKEGRLKKRVPITKMDGLSLRDLEQQLIEDITLAALHDNGTPSGAGTDEIVAQLLLADCNSATTTCCSHNMVQQL